MRECKRMNEKRQRLNNLEEGPQEGRADHDGGASEGAEGVGTIWAAIATCTAAGLGGMTGGANSTMGVVPAASAGEAELLASGSAAARRICSPRVGIGEEDAEAE